MIDLSTVSLDIQEVLEDLRIIWNDNPESKYNPTALQKIRPVGSDIMFCCPFHTETNPSCGISTQYPYVFNCFGCGETGRLEKLVSHVAGLKGEFQGLQYVLRNYVLIDKSERPPIPIDDILDGRELDKKRSLPESEVRKYTAYRHDYILSRGFSERTLERYEIGYDSQTYSITFPVRTSNGNIRFIKRRSVYGKRFLNEPGIYKRDILYGLYYVLQTKTPIKSLFVTESETDTLACYESRLPAVALMGRILFTEQVRELMKAGITEVNLFLDNDDKGVDATLKAYDLISKMSPIRVNVVIYPGGHWGIDGFDTMPYKDANDLLLAGRMGDITLVTFDTFKQLLKSSN